MKTMAKDEDKEGGKATKQQQLMKELRPMLYGFGDDPNPHPDSVALVEELTLAYLSGFLKDCLNTANNTGSSKVRLDDIMYVLRKDKKKTARVEELLYMNEELKKARRAFEMDEATGGNNNNHININDE